MSFDVYQEFFLLFHLFILLFVLRPSRSLQFSFPHVSGVRAACSYLNGYLPHLLGARTLHWEEVHGGMAASRPRSVGLRDVQAFAVTPELSAPEQRAIWREYAREHGLGALALNAPPAAQRR